MVKKILIAWSLAFTALVAHGAVVSGADSTCADTGTKPVRKPEAGTSLTTLRTFDQLQMPAVVAQGDPIVIPAGPLADSTAHHRAKAEEYHTEVMRRQALVDNLNDLSLLELPVGIAPKNDDLNYTVIISQIRVTPAGSFIEAYLMFEIPETGDRIAFHGTDIRFSHEGGIVGDGRLELVGTYPIKLNDKTLLNILGKGNTFVEFDCDGFKSLGLEAGIEFSRDLIVPEDEKGNRKPAPERVKTRIATVAQSWSDLLLGVTIPPFQVSALNGVGFSVSEAYLDWSDLANPPGLMFPPGYTSPYVAAGEPALWHGFYLQRLEVRLPPSFAKKQGDGSRITIGVEHAILDDQGFSGTAFVENLMQAGDMNGWGYTLDRVGLELVTNQVKGFEVEGKLSIPVVKSTEGKPTQFGYLAQRGADGNYIFAVKVESDVKIPLWAADVKLYQGSAVIVKERDNKFYPSASLNGELTINVLGKGPKAKFNSIRFEQMVVSSEAPHFQPGTFGFGSEGNASSASGYPLVIRNIMVKSEGERVGLGFDVTINIGGSPEEEGFGGTAALTVWGKQESTPAEGETATTQGDWKFDKVEISGIGINIRKPGVIEIAGMIRFFEDDPVYGDGFKGTVSGKIQVISLQIEALFGRTPEYRYWYADALVELKNGIPLVPGFSAYGFGGGFYSKMKQSTESVPGSIGETLSGITYVPDENTIGIKAMVMFGATGRPEPYNGDVTLEVMLNRHGGINSVTFTGNVKVMTAPLPGVAGRIKEMVPAAVGGKALDKLMDLAQGQVYGSVKIHFDNVNDIFHANAEIYVNVAGGLVRGVSSGNKAGWAVMHFSKSEWYFLVGTPDQPIGLEILRLLKVRSYFMLGKNLPGSPPPPHQVSEILGGIDLDYMRDLNSLESGTGFAFGLHLGVDTGDLRFLMFYGRFSAGIGADIMLKNYGTEYHCEGSSDPIGINGWYANGQAYAFVQGKIGIRVNLAFYKGNYDILSIGAAAVLQSKGPNPFWMRGIVGGYYRILGGLVKGRCRFEVTIGKDCKIVGPAGNPLGNVKIIAELSPAKGDTDVDVFNAPQAAFNMAIGETFEITDLENKKHVFRGNLKEFKIMDGTRSLPGSVRWNDEYDVAAFDAHDVLPPRKELKVVVKVTFEERIGGTWKVVMFDGKPAEEVSETAFTTGEAPDYIPASNVAFSYPVAGQFNFYPGEYGNGFITLKKGQPYLFEPGAEWIQKVRMTDNASQTWLETDLQYRQAEKQVRFNIPAGFRHASVYHFEILNFPRQQQLLDENVKNVETDISTGEDETVLTTKNIEGNLALRDVKSIYTTYFRTSKYNTFLAKVRAMSLSPALSGNPGNNVHILGAYWRGDEYFDGAEIGTGINRMIDAEAVLKGNPWYEQNIYPLIYKNYPLAGAIRIRNRATETLGMPPVKDVYLAQDKNDLKVSASGEAPDPAAYFSGSLIEYLLPLTMFSDYYDLQYQAANYVVDHPGSTTTALSNLLVSPFPVIDYGSYKVKLHYRIPGTDVTTSSYEVELSYLRDPTTN